MFIESCLYVFAQTLVMRQYLKIQFRDKKIHTFVMVKKKDNKMNDKNLFF